MTHNVDAFIRTEQALAERNQVRDYIRELQRANEEAEREYDRVFDAKGTTGANMRRAGIELSRTWDAYIEACREAGICTRVDCYESTIVANRRLCPTHRRQP